MLPSQHSKNTVYGFIHANGNVHIGDITYIVERDFKAGSILFLRLDKKDATRYEATLSVKSRHSTQGTLATSGVIWCEQVAVDIPTHLVAELAEFQDFRRRVDAQTRYKGLDIPNNRLIAGMEDALGERIFQTFFAGETGKVCAHFIQLLEEQRIDELLLAISTKDDTIVNLPFEMALPWLFPPKLGEAKKGLAINTFGLVRTKVPSLDSHKAANRRPERRGCYLEQHRPNLPFQRRL
jgi:hypothetical protein